MKHYLLHLRAPIRALFALLAFSAVSLSVEAQAQAQEQRNKFFRFFHNSSTAAAVPIRLIFSAFINS